MARPTFGGLAPLPVMPGCLLPCVRQSQMQMCISTFQVPFRDQTSFLPLDRQPTAARGGGMARPSNRLVPRQTRQTMTVMPTTTERRERRPADSSATPRQRQWPSTITAQASSSSSSCCCCCCRCRPACRPIPSESDRQSALRTEHAAGIPKLWAHM